MKFAEQRPYADPEAAARKLIEIANSVEAVQEGRIHIEKINWPFLHDLPCIRRQEQDQRRNVLGIAKRFRDWTLMAAPSTG